MHPVLSAAADGRLPDWADASPDRRDHMVRVADVMAGWADRLGLSEDDARRWRAAAMLHDALRDADPEALREQVSRAFRAWPGAMLHGPAAAGRLEADGVDDAPLVTAVRWHTVGHTGLDRLGKALYVADFTEPGRGYHEPALAEVRERAPDDLDAAVVDTLKHRIGRTLAGGHPLRGPTVAFWNALVARG